MSSFLCFPDFVFGFQHSAVICQGVALCVIFVYPDFVTAVATAAVSLGKPQTSRRLWALPVRSPPALLGPIRLPLPRVPSSLLSALQSEVFS